VSNFYEQVGGEKFFADLTSQFYAVVATDPILRPMYPDTDMKGAALRLQWFLEQYWGGPTTYSDERGHPRLRQRHFPFVIGERERDRWMVHMMAAVDELSPNETVHQQLTEYMTMASTAMINSPGATI
jgi:hemoglobin